MSEEDILTITPGFAGNEVVEKFLSIALPVKVSPSVDVKPVKTEACGRPIITTSKHGKCDIGNKNGDCEFTIIQKMKVEIPVTFRIKTDIDDPCIDCEIRKECDEHKD